TLIALKQSFPCCPSDRVVKRIRFGIDMLRDRACPEGGWNAGHGIVFGAALKPHIDATAIALLALQGHEDPITIRALKWLRQACRDCSSPYSLAWSAIALLTHTDSALDACMANLARQLTARPSLNIDALSLAAIAMKATRDDGNPFRGDLK